MKKSLLFTVLATGMALSLSAETKVYSFDTLGEINGVSDNGLFGAVTDPDNGLAYIWDASSPETLKEITANQETAGSLLGAKEVLVTTANDVSDEGVVVGSVFIGETQNPAYFKDGEWHLLPLDPAALYTNEAICITPDAKTIAGYQFINDPTSEIKGRYYPCQWFLQDDGSYKLKSYTNIELPDHQGFYPMTQSPDGEVIAGTVYAGFQSNLNAIVKNGELILFDEVETKMEPFMFGGKYYAGFDENGKQIWVTDINDPRVEWFPEVYINGYKDKGDSGVLNGFFTNCDGDGNLYGARSLVKNVTEDGDGYVVNEAVIYNYKTDTWYEATDYSFFSAGIGTGLIFTGDGRVIKDDKISSVVGAYDIKLPVDVEGINKISGDASVLGGVISEFNPAISSMMYYPFFVTTDAYTSGIQEIAGTPAKGFVVVTAGCIEVLNVEDIAIYDLNGRLISKNKMTYVDPGIYVVKAGKETYKVNVR